MDIVAWREERLKVARLERTSPRQRDFPPAGPVDLLVLVATRRLLVVHPDPRHYAIAARRAVRTKWDKWKCANLLRYIESKLTATVT